MPTEWEESVAYNYVHFRKLNRPDTSYKKVIVYLLLFIAATGVLIWLLHYLLIEVGFLTYLSPAFRDFIESYPSYSVVIICAAVVLVELFFFSKYAIIGLIKLYQHYAPDEMRRRCLFMPTCSEYTILAVKKYGSIVGLCKSYYRLVFLCRGNIYKIHYPNDKIV
ncbi:MAG: membrane protein insertion efficiency factor YidD [Oscillospiraceae bacterium]|jgi:putative component of membrane protein insertase Oxa1/YidC/SpoIIIJ protein YidD|nr:membrane protein insertion efficiency factor YidD [Oscillospiraceae bacterium]